MTSQEPWEESNHEHREEFESEILLDSRGNLALHWRTPALESPAPYAMVVCAVT
jgi:hypothetical protein